MKPGSTILVIGKGILADAIRAHMDILGRQTGRPYRLDYTHSEKVVLVDDQLQACGSRQRGATMSPVAEYLKNHPHFLILDPVIDLTPDQIKSQAEYAILLCRLNKRKYQFGNFLAWILYLKTWGKIAIMGKTDKKNYCFELTWHFDKLVERESSHDGPFISIFDLFENTHFKTKSS